MSADLAIDIRPRPGTFDPRRARQVIVVLAAVAVVLALVFMVYDLRGSLSYALELRTRRLAALAIVGVCLGASAVMFHTITHNRILTPSMIGFDALYVLIQISAAYAFGTFAFLRFDVRVRFAIELALMLGFAIVLQRWLLGRHRNDLYLLVLVGIVLGAMFTGLTAFVSRMIDPNEYITLQDQLFASFSTANEDLLVVAALTTGGTLVLTAGLHRRLDVVALGHANATSLGVDYGRVVDATMLAVAVLVSVATALVGPITFLGILVSNLAYRLTGTFRHRYTVATASLIAVVALVGGQFVLERVFHSTTRLSVIIGFVGGIYFIVLLLRGVDR